VDVRVRAAVTCEVQQVERISLTRLHPSGPVDASQHVENLSPSIGCALACVRVAERCAQHDRLGEKVPSPRSLPAPSSGASFRCWEVVLLSKIG
jgi:hypothetical protein